MTEFAARGDKVAVERGEAFAPRFDEAGLIPAVAQDAATGRVLMLAWMNREALAETLSTGLAVYFSRSRGRLWRKGEESGHVQRVVEVLTDCDQDVVLLRVEQVGGACCHNGYERCFYRSVEADAAKGYRLKFNDTQRVFDPDKVYGR